MIFKITLESERMGQLLPLSYQYEMSAWIYKLIEDGNLEFAKFLHSKGYTQGKKRFKLFTFSNLRTPKYDIIDDRLKILSKEISFKLSFLVDEAAQHLVFGLFKNKKVRLGDKKSQASFRIKSVEMQNVYIDSNEIRLKTLSPILLSKNEIWDDGSQKTKYLSPIDKGYEMLFAANLLNKYSVAEQKGFVDQLELEEQNIGFKLLTMNPKSKLIRIKADKDEETKLKGYKYEFEITAPKKVIELGILAGFGEKNALGFGATRIIKSR